MSDCTEFMIGSDVSCSDGVCGELKRVVVDPVAIALTHLVVEPKYGSVAGRLVPIDLVASAGVEIPQGLVVEPADHHVTHVLLDEGHLWGKKEVAIPIGAVTSVDDGVRLSLTKDEVADLPPVELDHAD